MREQHVFWPWHEHDFEHRAHTDVPSLDVLHRGLIELLEAGDEYRVGYATAFRHRGLAALADLQVPVCFGNRRSDSVWKTHALYPPGARTREFPADPRAAAREEPQVLLEQPAPPPPSHTGQVETAGRTTLNYIDLAEAQILLRSCGDLHARPPLVILHHAPGSSALYDDLVVAVRAERPVLAFDLPGHGESDLAPGVAQDVAGWTTALLRVLDALRLGRVHLYGHGSGAAVAVEAALRAPERIASLLLDAPMAFPDRERTALGRSWLDGVLPVTPCWEGSHVLRVWHMLRDAELWFPWHDRRQACARAVAPNLDLAALTLRVREMVKQPEQFAPAWLAAWDYPLAERLARTAPPCHLLGAETDMFFQYLPLARAMRPDARFDVVADDASRAAVILAAPRSLR